MARIARLSKRSKNLATRTEVTQAEYDRLVEITREAGGHCEKIVALHQEAREIVGERDDFGYMADLVWGLDKRRTAETNLRTALRSLGVKFPSKRVSKKAAANG